MVAVGYGAGWTLGTGGHMPVVLNSGVPRNSVREGSANSVEDRGQTERGSGGR
jgi:hypothetical protein